ncbi:MAG TPA: helix-turn-helix domain-containing protein [Puia sp.]|nr:helix-turn-helix domain-containing protein [Puia sp.]
MKHLYSYKYRLNPTKEQEILLNKHFGCVRYLYNYFLENRIKLYKETGQSRNYYDNATEIPLKEGLRELEFSRLDKCSDVRPALSRVLVDLEATVPAAGVNS